MLFSLKVNAARYVEYVHEDIRRKTINRETCIALGQAVCLQTCEADSKFARLKSMSDTRTYPAFDERSWLTMAGGASYLRGCVVER